MKTLLTVLALSMIGTGTFCQQKNPSTQPAKKVVAKKTNPKSTAPKTMKVKMTSNYHSSPTKRTDAATKAK